MRKLLTIKNFAALEDWGFLEYLRLFEEFWLFEDF